MNTTQALVCASKHSGRQEPKWFRFCVISAGPFSRPRSWWREHIAATYERCAWPVAVVLPVCFKIQDVQETRQQKKNALLMGQRIHLIHCLTCIDRTGKGSPLRLSPSSGRRSWSGQKRGGSATSPSRTRTEFLSSENHNGGIGKEQDGVFRLGYCT